MITRQILMFTLCILCGTIVAKAESYEETKMEHFNHVKEDFEFHNHIFLKDKSMFFQRDGKFSFYNSNSGLLANGIIVVKKGEVTVESTTKIIDDFGKVVEEGTHLIEMTIKRDCSIVSKSTTLLNDKSHSFLIQQLIYARTIEDFLRRKINHYKNYRCGVCDFMCYLLRKLLH